MKNVMGIINNAQKNNELRLLTKNRSLASVPFGCRYRLIDFSLSNLVNSGITNVGILLEYKIRSLLDHIGPGKAWDLHRKRDGLFILPSIQMYEKNRICRGDIENFHCNVDYLYRSKQDYVIITTPNIICNMTYYKAFDFHKEVNADITVIYKKQPTSNNIDSTSYTVLNTDKNNKVTDMKVNPYRGHCNKISLDKFIMKKELLIDILDDCYSKGKFDFVKDGIIDNIKELDIYGYPFEGYFEIINSVESYFKCSLDLLKPEVWNDIFLKSNIYTKPKDEAPTKFSSDSKVKNVLAANGCIIDGDVENSILFRGVKIGKGASVKNSIIMQKSVVENDTKLENVILDKNSRVTSEQLLKGSSKFPLLFEKNAVV